MGNIDGLCTPCHDPHGVTDNTDKIAAADKQYAVPLLKGTWLTSLYKEDSAPVNNEVGTIRTDRGKEGIRYHIDQNTFGSDIIELVIGIQEPDSKFAGLCLNCHPKNSLTDGATHTWKSKDRIHESVKGWKTADTTIQHNYPCSKCHTPHNSRLPRLMVTNCLDYRHKGHMGNTPSPIISGSGTSSCTYSPDYLLGCEGEESITVGNCAIVKAAKIYCCGGSGCGANYSLNHGYGSGGIPGGVGGGRYGSSMIYHLVTCHEGNDPNQGWNSKTPWTQ